PRHLLRRLLRSTLYLPYATGSLTDLDVQTSGRFIRGRFRVDLASVSHLTPPSPGRPQRRSCAPLSPWQSSSRARSLSQPRDRKHGGCPRQGTRGGCRLLVVRTGSVTRP